VVVYNSSVTNPLNSFQTNFGRFYAHPASGVSSVPVIGFGVLGPRVEIDPYDSFAPKPSITNIIGMMDKKFLPAYYAKLVAEYAIENLDSLRYQVEKFGSQVAAGSLKAVPNLPNKNAVIGDEIHGAIDAWCQGADMDKYIAGVGLSSTALAMYAQWVHFTESLSFYVERSEYTVWSYQHGYAGTGDLMLQFPADTVSPQGIVIPKGLWIIDTKSGNRIYPEVALQTTAAAHADVILDAEGNESPMPPVDVQGVMHIRPRSVKLHQLERTEEAWDTFLACKRIFDWKRFDAENVIQEPFKSEKPKGAM
jgi:hypothetical protein